MDYQMPMHIQLKKILREKIDDGEYQPGDQIPSERELARLYGLNRMTVRHAITQLVKEGLLKRVQGKGTLVLQPRVTRDLIELKGFSQTMKDRGITPSSKVLSIDIIESTRKLRQIFQLEQPQPIVCINRLRLGNTEPIALEETYVPHHLLPDIERFDLKVFSLYDVYAYHGIQLHTAYQTLTLTKLEQRIAKLLHLPPDSAVFLFECTSYDRMGQPIEFTRSYTRGDYSKFYTELHQNQDLSSPLSQPEGWLLSGSHHCS